MSLTRIGSIGINTGIAFAGVTTIVTLNTANDALSIGSTVNVGSGITLGASGDIFATGVSTVTTLKVGSGVTVSSDGDVFFTGIATGNGSGLTALNASNISSGTVPTARLGSGTASSSTFLRGDSTFQTVNTDLVSDTSPQLGGNLASNGNEIVMADNDKIKIGTGEDLEIFHNGSNSFITNASTGGFLHIRSVSGINLQDDTGDENFLKCIDNGAVELYYDNSKKFETDSIGVKLDDNNHVSFGTGSDFKIHFDGSNSYLDASAGNVYFRGNSNEHMLQLHQNGAVELYHNNTKQCETSANGLAFPDGKGIDFSSNTENESGDGASTGQLLDDYEEGTWTPAYDALDQSSTTFSHNRQYGYYTKIGNLVHVTCYIQGSVNTNEGGGSNDSLQITGLPFTPATLPSGGNIRHAASMAVGSRYRMLVDDLIINVYGGQTYARLFEHTSGNTMVTVKTNQITPRSGTNETYFAGSFRVHA